VNVFGSTALVTGANRGLGREFAQQLLARGATVIATARRPDAIDLPGVRALRLDVTDAATIAAARAATTDLSLLINNAGVATATPLLDGDPSAVRLEMETHFFGTLAVTRAFAPLLVAAGGGAVVNVMSTLSFRVFPGNGAYAAAKAAEWQLTNGLRLELAEHGTQVLGAHLSSTDTDMMAGWDVPKNDPVEVVRSVLDALERGEDEILVDDETRAVKALLSEPPAVLYSPFLAPVPRRAAGTT
jgi:NAD(P)-dependent dehydrogenase (short-subunit alcohol dehydrogenase family)